MTKVDPYGAGKTGWDSDFKRAMRFANRSQVEHWLRYWTDRPDEYEIKEIER